MHIGRDISYKIEPNYSTWETIEISHKFAKENPGNFVECGVAAGNNLAAMCATGGFGYGFDSFEGIPWATDKDDQQPGMSEIPKIKEGKSSGISSHSLESVHQNFERWGLTNYKLIKGWFEDTLPNQDEVKEISVLRLDGDMYESTLTSLTYLYPLLKQGGILIIDDWQLVGCRTAVYEYFKLKLPQQVLYYSGVKYFKK